jgi:GDP-mannose 6-dehydrogenase
MARISVFGIGYVGVVSAACLARDGHEVVAVDLDPEKVRAVNEGRSPIVEKGLDELLARVVAEGRLRATTDAAEAVAATDASFVCVGTPSAPDGSVGLDYVRGACESIGRAVKAKGGFHSVIVRSTIVPGTMVGTCIPALEQASGLRPARASAWATSPSSCAKAPRSRTTTIRGSSSTAPWTTAPRRSSRSSTTTSLRVHLVDVTTAEMVKYTSNSWRAVKITFANEIGNIAKACGLDGQQVMRMLCSDDKVAMSPAFLRPGFAFGGSCLPKDVRALRALARTKGSRLRSSIRPRRPTSSRSRGAEEMVRASGMTSVGSWDQLQAGHRRPARKPPGGTSPRASSRDGREVRIYDPYVAIAVPRPRPRPTAATPWCRTSARGSRPASRT